MSRLWRSRLTVLIEAQRVSVDLASAVWRRGLIRNYTADCDDSGSGSNRRWRTAFEALDRLWRDESMPRADVDVILSDAFVRYVLAPWAGGGNEDDELEFARSCLSSTYEMDANDWTVVLDEPRYGTPRLACAIETALIDDMVSLFRRNGSTVQSLVPRFVRLVDQVRRKSVMRDALILVTAHDHIVCATCRDEVWASVRVVATRPGSDDALTTLERRERVLQALPDSVRTLALVHDVAIGKALAAKINCDVVEIDSLRRETPNRLWLQRG